MFRHAANASNSEYERWKVFVARHEVAEVISSTGGLKHSVLPTVGGVAGGGEGGGGGGEGGGSGDGGGGGMGGGSKGAGGGGGDGSGEVGDGGVEGGGAVGGVSVAPATGSIAITTQAAIRPIPGWLHPAVTTAAAAIRYRGRAARVLVRAEPR